MSNAVHTTKKEHGTTRSYIIGFILSLIFTIMPYHLVVNQTVSGRALLATILGFAILQMAVQLLFFLHLGRGPKPLYNVVFFFATAGIIVVTISASLFIMSNLYRNMAPDEVTKRLAQEEGIAQVGGKLTGACQGVKKSHFVTISGGTASPLRIDAQRCDTLTLINQDDQMRTIRFSTSSQNASYGGVDEVTVRKGRPETITLNEVGEYTFHDQQVSELQGYFSVTE
jgi:cytochrome o ubiquinol oxidase operon protein cyoD